MRLWIATLAVGAALACGGAVEARDWKTVRIATEGAYAPWNAIDASGKLVGFEVDLAQELCRRIAAECQVVAQDWDGMIPALQQGRYDAIMAGMSITEERQRAIDFAGPYAAEPAMFATRNGSPLAAAAVPVERVDLEAETAASRQAVEAMRAALRGRVVGVQVSTAQSRFLEEAFPEVAVRSYEKIDAAALDLAAGRIDALLANRSAIEAVSGSHADSQLVTFGPPFTRGVLGRGVGVGLRKQDADLKALLDKAIADATTDGTVSRLSLQHFGFDVSVGPR